MTPCVLRQAATILSSYLWLRLTPVRVLVTVAYEPWQTNIEAELVMGSDQREERVKKMVNIGKGSKKMENSTLGGGCFM